MRGTFSWPVSYVFFTSRLKVNLYVLDEMGFLGEFGKAGLRQGGKWHASTGSFAGSTIKSLAFLWGALAPLGQVLLKCKVELQILQLTAIKAALGFGWGFRRVFFQYLLG